MRRRWWRRTQRGQTNLEYAVLAGLLVLALVGVLIVFGRVFLGRVDEADRSGPFRPPTQPVACDANYAGGCVPAFPPDVDCDDLERLGLRNVRVVGSDPHELDPDFDGRACA